ncbi:MAG: ExeM/NucH family extracellular endonuclease, partial [Planctomycetota bacterium]
MRSISVTFGLCIVCAVGTVRVLAGPIVRIHDIQGTGPASPMAGATAITIEGMVVGDFQGTSSLSGFFVQEQHVDGDPLTSEGIFVYEGAIGTDVSAGDVVNVTGDVTEYYGLTELTRVTDIAVVGSGQLPEPAVVALPVADITEWERYEGMLVHIDQVMVVAGTANLARSGEVVLSVGQRLYAPTNVAAPGRPALAVADLTSRSSMQLDDGRTIANPRALHPYLGLDNTLRVGDTVTGLTGVLSYGFGAYELQPFGPVEFERANPRPPLSAAPRETIKVACLNVFNYFNGNGQGGGFPTSRGAETVREFNRQTDKIVSAIASIDPDIAGLVEIENDEPPDSAIEDLTSALNNEYAYDAYD